MGEQEEKRKTGILRARGYGELIILHVLLRHSVAADGFSSAKCWHASSRACKIKIAFSCCWENTQVINQVRKCIRVQVGQSLIECIVIPPAGAIDVTGQCDLRQNVNQEEEEEILTHYVLVDESCYFSFVMPLRENIRLCSNQNRPPSFIIACRPRGTFDTVPRLDCTTASFLLLLPPLKSWRFVFREFNDRAHVIATI